MLAPITFFAFNRPYKTYLTLSALSQNKESKDTDLIVFIDGPKNNGETRLINSVEDIVLSFKNSFNSLTINKSDINKGSASSQIIGISKVLRKYQNLIVVEDDILVSEFFLKYMNKALYLYKNDKDVWHINGYNFPNKVKGSDCYFSSLMICWGWATWSDRWFKHIKDPLYHDPYYLKEIFDKKMIRELNLGTNTNFFWAQVESNSKGHNSWDIFWYCYIFLNKGLCLTPQFSLTRNIGHDGSGIHCRADKNIQNAPLNTNEIKNYPKAIIENTFYKKEMAKYLKKTYSKKAKIIRFIKSKPSIRDLLKSIKNFLIT